MGAYMVSRRQSGFSVIEALVAVAIVAIALLPLAQLQGQASHTAAQQQMLQQRLTAERSALAVLRDLNVMAAGSGVRDLGGGVTLHWSARPISASVNTLRGGFAVRLYTVHVILRESGGQPVSTFDIEQLGWRPLANAS